MRAAIGVGVAAIGLVVGATSIVAHHSFAAEYDATRSIVLRGIVTRMEWTNPHAHCYIDVGQDTAGVANWNVELASPKVLAQNGWKPTSLKVGDDITVEAAQAKDGSTRANARIVTLADGRRVSAGSSGGDFAPR